MWSAFAKKVIEKVPSAFFRAAPPIAKSVRALPGKLLYEMPIGRQFISVADKFMCFSILHAMHRCVPLMPGFTAPIDLSSVPATTIQLELLALHKTLAETINKYGKMSHVSLRYLSEVGRSHLAIGELKEAYSLFFEARTICQALSPTPENLLLLSDAHVNFAYYYQAIEQFDRAVAEFKKAVSSCEPLQLALSHPVALRYNRYLVAGLLAYGDVENALALSQKLSSMPSTAKGSADMIQDIINTGVIATLIGKEYVAQKQYEKLLAQFPESSIISPAHRAVCLSNYAVISALCYQPTKAQEAKKQALDLVIQVLGVKHPLTCIISANDFEETCPHRHPMPGSLPLN